MNIFPKKQSGAASAIVVFILLIVVASMVAVTVNMSNSSLSDSIIKNKNTQALYFAEAAMERIKSYLNDTPSCNTLDGMIPDTTNIAGGTVSIDTVTWQTTPTDEDAVECTVKVAATFNGVTRYIEFHIVNLGGTGGGGGGSGGGLVDHFSPMSGWTWVPTGVQEGNYGSSGESCPTGTCNGYDGNNVAENGSAYATVTSGGGNRDLMGYFERELDENVDTRGGGIVLDWSIGFKKFATGSGGIRQRLSMELADDAGNTDQIWQDNTQDRSNTWAQASGTGLALTDGREYKKIRLNIELRGRADRIPEIWLDEITLSAGDTGGGGAAPNWQVLEWQEVEQ